MHALILAGGKGTRLRPLTDTRPKPLMPFMGEPFLAGLLRRLAGADVVRVSLLIGADARPFDALRPLAAELGMSLEAVTEEQPLDTAGAVRRLLHGSRAGPVLVCNGDVLTDLDYASLLASHRRRGAEVTIALAHVEDTSAYGVVVCDTAGRVQRFVEKPPPGTVEAGTINAGTYVLSPTVLEAFPGDGPLSFEREVFPGLLGEGAYVAGYLSDAFWADLGTPERYLAGTRAVLEGRCRWPRAPGMLPLDETALVHTTATAEGAHLAGGVVIGPRCRVEPGAELRDAVLFSGAAVGGGARVHGAILGEGARVGRAARLSPGVVVADGEVVAAGSHRP